MQKLIKKFSHRFPKKNLKLFAILFGIILLTVIGVTYKFFFDYEYIYVKVKIGQGLWWAPTNKPPVWYSTGAKKGEVKKNLLGTIAEVLKVRSYPTWGTNQYDVYVDLKLRVTYDKNYLYERSPVAVGSPINIIFPNFELNGTVIELSKDPFKDKMIEKTVVVVSQGGYQEDFPYRWNALKVGSKYFDGEEYVLEVLDKKLEKNIWSITNILNAEVFEKEIDTHQNIVATLKLKVQEKKDGLYYAEEYKILPNSPIPPFVTTDYVFDTFQLREIK